MKVNILTLLLLCGLATPSTAGNDDQGNLPENRKYPVPRLTETLLFYVQRTHNRNTVIYELNYQANGVVDQKEPLHPLWIRYEEGGVRKELSYMQNRVYGLNIRCLNKDSYVFHFRSYKKREVYLVRNEKNNHFKAMIKINGKMAVLTSLFICSVNNALGIPSTVKYIDINGVDPATGNSVNERVIP
jgi:hypothetical protein